MTALDSGDIAAIALLDLYAAFDMVDHSVLLRRLQKSFWLNGVFHIVSVPAPTTRVTSWRALSNDDHPVRRATGLCTRPDTVRTLHSRYSALGRAARY